LEVNIDAADQELAEALQIDEGTKLVKLERLRGSEETPFVYFISWFHPRVELTGTEDFSRSLYKILEEDLSVIPSRSDEELKAIPADEEIAKYLNISEREAVLYRKRMVYDAGDRIIEYNVGFYRGDKFTYSIDIKRDFK
jgi:GntR family transcriptional regulator